MADRRNVSFRDSTISFAFMAAIVAVLAVGILILLDPRAQLFWGQKLNDLWAATRAAVSGLPWMR